jgi:Tfp pilus assembly protein PilX
MQSSTNATPATDSEQGVIAVIMAMAVVTLLTVTVGIVFQVASSSQHDASFRRQQAQALDAAEGGLNLSYETIQQTATSALPCGTNALSQNFGTVPEASSFAASVTYYDTYPPTDNALSCSSAHAGGTLAAAQIISTGSDGPVAQYMEALVKLSVTDTGPVFDQALFSNATMTGSNSGTIDGHTGNDANLYVNGSVVCGNGFSVQGSVVDTGTFSGSNTCSVTGNLTSVGNISLQNSTVIGGNATSTGHSGCGTGSTQGNISMSNSATVDQSAYSYCTISLSNNATVVHSQVPNDTTLTNPPVETFPVVPEPVNGSATATAWSAAGYTNQITDNVCTPSGVYTDIANMASATAPTVIITSCALTWANSSSLSLNQNLAIFSTGGFAMQNSTAWQSTTTATHLLYLMVPSTVGGTNTTCNSGTGQPGITLQNSTTFASSVDVMLYTPCTISISNGTTGYGQVYGGVVNTKNSYTAHYVPLPTVPGASGGGSASTTALTLAIVYERQIASLAFA